MSSMAIDYDEGSGTAPCTDRLSFSYDSLKRLTQVLDTAAQGTVLCVLRESLIIPCFPVKTVNYSGKNSTRGGFGPPGQRKTGNEKQHREPSPVFPSHVTIYAKYQNVTLKVVIVITDNGPLSDYVEALLDELAGIYVSGYGGYYDMQNSIISAIS